MTEQQIKEMSLFNVRKLKINILLMRLKAIFFISSILMMGMMQVAYLIRHS